MIENQPPATTTPESVIGWRELWAQEKCNLAFRLAAGHINGTYAEAAIISCAVLNALAADVWPLHPGGAPIGDHARFVEALIAFSPPDSNARMISVPLLVERLTAKGRFSDAAAIGEAISQQPLARVLTGKDCDREESEILTICPGISVKDVRACSYASLLYREVRSAYAHEYRPGAAASAWPMTGDKTAFVSYVNVGDKPRQIHVHLRWLVNVIVAVARAIDRSEAAERTPPAVWWLNGEP